jgi:RNA polymerase sigma factor (sigma-70 family)
MNVAELTNEDITKHNGMVHKLAGKYFRQVRDPAIDFEDLISEAQYGLIKAYERFDPDKGFAFSTFAFTTVSGYLQSFLDRRGSQIRYPAQVVLLGTKINKKDLADQPLAVIAEQLGVTVAAAELALTYLRCRMTTSLEKPLNDKYGTPDLDSSHEAFTKTEDDLTGLTTEEFLQRLSPKMQQAVRLRMDGFEYKNISRIMGVSRARIEQHMRKAGAKYVKLYSREERITMAKFTMTAEAYFAERHSGKTIAQIAREQGVTEATIYNHMNKWAEEGKVEGDVEKSSEESQKLLHEKEKVPPADAQQLDKAIHEIERLTAQIFGLEESNGYLKKEVERWKSKANETVTLSGQASEDLIAERDSVQKELIRAIEENDRLKDEINRMITERDELVRENDRLNELLLSAAQAKPEPVTEVNLLDRSIAELNRAKWILNRLSTSGEGSLQNEMGSV